MQLFTAHVTSFCDSHLCSFPRGSSSQLWRMHGRNPERKKQWIFKRATFLKDLNRRRVPCTEGTQWTCGKWKTKWWAYKCVQGKLKLFQEVGPWMEAAPLPCSSKGRYPPWSFLDHIKLSELLPEHLRVARCTYQSQGQVVIFLFN